MAKLRMIACLKVLGIFTDVAAVFCDQKYTSKPEASSDNHEISKLVIPICRAVKLVGACATIIMNILYRLKYIHV